MIDPATLTGLRSSIKEEILAERSLLEELIEDVKPLKSRQHRIAPRSSTAVAMVGTDGGNNSFVFDPFDLHIVRIVDSSRNELFVKVLSSQSSIDRLSKSHFDHHGRATDMVGALMEAVGVRHLRELSHMLGTDSKGRAKNRGWIYDYRQIVEWAVLLSLILQKEYGTDTLFLFDGLLRTKVFFPGIFPKIQKLIAQKFEEAKKSKRHLYLCGIAKKNKLLTRYRLAMLGQKVLHTPYPSFVEVPPKLEKKTYEWEEFAARSDEEIERDQPKDFVAGRLFFAKFGPKSLDPIWAVDIFDHQKDRAPQILGHLLFDAAQGFPVPYYPLALQKAHEYAALVDFDYDLLQSQIYEAVREILHEERDVLDIFALLDKDPAKERY